MTDCLQGLLGDDARENVAVIRRCTGEILGARRLTTEAEALKHLLLTLSPDLLIGSMSKIRKNPSRGMIKNPFLGPGWQNMTNTAGLPEHDGPGVFCNYCPGFCCYRLPGSTLLVTATDINRIARHLQISDGLVRRNYIEKRNTFQVREDGSCIFLADGKLSRRCSIHLARPAQCRAFPNDSPCPYINRDDLLEIIYPKVERSLGLVLPDTGKDEAC